jgi:hypothetical protein
MNSAMPIADSSARDTAVGDRQAVTTADDADTNAKKTRRVITLDDRS